jgi:hypothetical protein
MKNFYTYFFLVVIYLLACNRSMNPPMPPANPPAPGKYSVVGTWKTDSVISYFYDASGFRGREVYPGPQWLYFHFNSDNTWVQTFTADPAPPSVSDGTYTRTSDSTFALVSTGGINPSAPCKILSLSDHVFVFSRQDSTLFDGVTPGYDRRVFGLSK